jgi:hypothetical protein
MGLFGFERRKKKKLTEIWPKNEDGKDVPPVFLTHTGGAAMDEQILLSMLEAYGIPAVTKYPGDGTFGKVVLGASGYGADIYVPETMYEDAKALLAAEAEPSEEEAGGGAV